MAHGVYTTHILSKFSEHLIDHTKVRNWSDVGELVNVLVVT